MFMCNHQLWGTSSSLQCGRYKKIRVKYFFDICHTCKSHENHQTRKTSYVRFVLSNAHRQRKVTESSWHTEQRDSFAMRDSSIDRVNIYGIAFVVVIMLLSWPIWYWRKQFGNDIFFNNATNIFSKYIVLLFWPEVIVRTESFLNSTLTSLKYGGPLRKHGYRWKFFDVPKRNSDLTQT